MTYTYRPDPDNPDARAICAHSDRPYPRSQLVKQMDYRGGPSPVWTGLWVHPDFLDKLDTANRETPLLPDPKPVRHPLPEPEQTGDGGDNTIYVQMLNGDTYDLWAGADANYASQVILWR